MRTSAIIRMILWAVVAFILLGFLIAGINGNLIHFNFNIGDGYYYDNANSYTKGGGELTPDGIDSIETNWIAGNVKITQYDGNKIIISESSKSTITDDNQLRYKVEDGKLTIQYTKAKRLFKMWINNSITKDLEVKIPQSIALTLNDVTISTVSANSDISGISVNELSIDNVSGRIEIANISASELTFDTVSGKINATNVKADNGDINTISGNVTYNGSINSIDCESVSGKLDIVSAVAPKNIDAESISGSIDISIPENDGFTANYDSVSGNFNCDFNTTQRNDSAIYKNGNANYSFDTVSGHIRINQITQM